jgi:tRNA threonylcarbamoyladenosine biosynthesis protein TsaB
MARRRACPSRRHEVFVAIETATDFGSVAVGTGSELAGEFVTGSRSRHAESLLPALDFLLRTARVERSALQGVIVGAGPGSFTGVRIAAATARGLACGLDVPLYAYSSLAALVYEAAVDDAGAVCALFDARRGEVYAGCYQLENGALRTVMEPAVLTVEDLVQRLAAVRPRYIGEGAVRYADRLGIAGARAAAPRASTLLRMAADDITGAATGRVAAPAGWEPSYLRTSGAERGIAG